MKVAFAYLFRRLRRLLEIPAEFVGGDPRCSISVNLKPTTAGLTAAPNHSKPQP